MDKNAAISLIGELSNAFGPSGFEDDAVEVLKKHCAPLGRIEEDSLRNLYVYRNENTGDKPVLMLDAHSDEVGAIVQAIRPNGTIRFLLLGGWGKAALPSSKVLVRNRLGEYLPGIVAAKPVHFMSNSERAGASYEATDLSIDIGASSKEEAEKVFHIGVGEPIVPAVDFECDEVHGLLFGKAFDCRIGCAALVETLKNLAGKELPFDIVGVFSSQEEVGERGAQVAVNKVRPDIALCFEGAPADDTFTEPWLAQTVLGKGAMLRYMDKSIICNPRYMRHAVELAEGENIPVQCAVREGGGNNGAMINLAGNGIPVIVAGVPVRYIHSSNCIAKYEDFESTVRFAVKLAESMSEALLGSL